MWLDEDEDPCSNNSSQTYSPDNDNALLTTALYPFNAIFPILVTMAGEFRNECHTQSLGDTLGSIVTSADQADQTG
jgi:hypothetical protein